MSMGLGPLPDSAGIRTREQAEAAITGLIGPSRRQLKEFVVPASPFVEVAPVVDAAVEEPAGPGGVVLSAALLERARLQTWPLDEMVAAAQIAVERLGVEKLTSGAARGDGEVGVRPGSPSEIPQARFRESVLWMRMRPVLAEVAPAGTMPLPPVRPVRWVILSLVVNVMRAIMMMACVAIGSAGVMYALSKGAESVVPDDNWVWEGAGKVIGRFADFWQALLVQMGWPSGNAIYAPAALLALPIIRETKYVISAAEPGPKPRLSARGVGDWHWGEIAAAVIDQTPAPSAAAVEEPPAAEQNQVRALLARAIDVRDETRAALAEWDQDLAAVLFDRRLLAVETEPLTAAFNDAFDKALDAVPDSPDLDVTVERAQEILDTARAAWEAWVAASRHAGEVGLGTMTDQEREAIALAKKYLAVAGNPGATDQERHTSIRRVIDTLTQVTHRARGAVESEVLRTVDARLLAIGAAPLQPALTRAATPL
ncbi:hypothetical protein [Tsukamurella hominis]|uniref:hypothetical protein n=1 Tax=Tsukamurella hominis TaxID=1970232 RepID=UPI0039E77A36